MAEFARSPDSIDDAVAPAADACASAAVLDAKADAPAAVAAKATAAATKHGHSHDVTFVKGVEDSAVQERFAAYVKTLHGDNTEARVVALRAVFDAHPFVRHGLPRTVELPEHSFEVVGYSLNIAAFRKWLKTSDPKTRSQFRGVSDDGLYALSSLLRQTLPRGASTGHDSPAFAPCCHS